MRSLVFATIFACVPFAAHAYIGPGAGIGAIAVTLAVLLGVILLIVGFLWYPLKRLLGGKKVNKGTDAISDTKE